MPIGPSPKGPSSQGPSRKGPLFGSSVPRFQQTDSPTPGPGHYSHDDHQIRPSVPGGTFSKGPRFSPDKDLFLKARSKIFDGEYSNEFYQYMKKKFSKVKLKKPKVSRKQSSEVYCICLGYTP